MTLMSKPERRRALKQAGVLHPQPSEVTDPLFTEQGEFFQADDLLQVRYELLRAHQSGDVSVVALCRRYGVSRQTFYNLLEKFVQGGTAGLLPKPPGPKGPSKLTPDVVTLVRAELARDPTVAGAPLAATIREILGVELHKRTVERLLRELRACGRVHGARVGHGEGDRQGLHES